MRTYTSIVKKKLTMYKWKCNITIIECLNYKMAIIEFLNYKISIKECLNYKIAVVECLNYKTNLSVVYTDNVV